MNAQEHQRTGMPCPECGVFIPMTIDQIISQGSFRCICQKIELTINPQKSAQAVSLLRDVKAAQNGVQAAKNGYG